MTRDRVIGAFVLVTLAVLVGVGLWRTRRPVDGRVVISAEPDRVMGTSCHLAAVVPPGSEAKAHDALRAAERSLRDVEARMSNYLDASEIARLNAADVGQATALSSQTLAVLRAAHAAAEQTQGAFDVTCRPLIELWTEAGSSGKLPSDGQIATARQASQWAHIELGDDNATRLSTSVRIDLGGIAKGFAIDRAVEAMRHSGVDGGMVDVGGDVACFGRPAVGAQWQIDVKSPFGDAPLAQLRTSAGAVCTSGNYARYVEFGPRRLSHIIDPRSGWPVEHVPSVTVVAATALQADIWSTALSVLGPQGVPLLPEGVEAIVVAGTVDDHEIHCTAGIANLIGSMPIGWNAIR